MGRSLSLWIWRCSWSTWCWKFLVGRDYFLVSADRCWLQLIHAAVPGDSKNYPCPCVTPTIYAKLYQDFDHIDRHWWLVMSDTRFSLSRTHTHMHTRSLLNARANALFQTEFSQLPGSPRNERPLWPWRAQKARPGGQRAEARGSASGTLFFFSG